MKEREEHAIDHDEFAERIEEQLNKGAMDISAALKLGFWVLYMDRKTEKHEMFMSKTLSQSLGIQEALSPQECFQYWYDAIHEDYRHYVNLGLEDMVRSGRLTQLEYMWNHPEDGEVMVRCMGIMTENKDGKVCIKGDYQVISDLDEPHFLSVGAESEIFEYDQEQGSIRFQTGRNLLYGDAGREEGFPECWIQQGMVHPHFVEEFCGMFQHLENSKEISGEEMLIKSKKGIYEWFNMKTRCLGSERHKNRRLLVLLEPADRERAVELEYLRKKSFYKAMLSDTVAYAEMDVESEQLKSAGGLWKAELEKCIERGDAFHQIMDFHKDRILAEDYEVYRDQCTLDAIKAMYKEGIPVKKFNLQYLIDGELRWVEMIIHVFQEPVYENMYALIYLKDIDFEKKRELAQAIAASRDPLTNLYNRKFFEYNVQHYMQNMDLTEDINVKPARGALLMLDVDDFKSVNDTYGHLKGDAVLKRLARVLEATFRQRDIVGRLGGDEFVVFLKGIDDKDLVSKRIDHLLETLKDTSYESGALPISCSVGITFVDGKRFSYEDSLHEADIALYESKERGKATYCYYEELKRPDHFSSNHMR